MTLEANTKPEENPVQKPDGIRRNKEGEELRTHDYWAGVLGFSNRDASAKSIIACQQYAIAKMNEKWPNTALDPSHTITKAQFEAAIAKAKEV